MIKKAILIILLLNSALAAFEPRHSLDNKRSDVFIGNREQGLTYNKNNIVLNAYSFNDNFYNNLEQGIDFKVYKKDDSILNVNISKMSCTSSLNSSLFARINYSSVFTTLINISIESSQGIGYVVIPKEAAVVDSYNDPSNTNVKELLYRFNHRFYNKRNVELGTDKLFLNWQTGLKGLVSSEVDRDIISDSIAALSYLRVYSGVDLHTMLFDFVDIACGYKGDFQTTSSQPFGMIDNQDIVGGLTLFLSKKFKTFVTVYDPMAFKICRENYVMQGKRSETGFELGLNKNIFIETKIINKINDENNYYNASLKLNNRDTSFYLYGTKNTIDQVFGVSLVLGFSYMSGRNNSYNRYEVKASNYTTSYPGPQILPSSNDSFENTVAALNTPEKAADYVSKRFNYNDSNTGVLGYLAGNNSAADVFKVKGGNSTEQMLFESYVLKKNGYDTYLLSYNTLEFLHSLCIYKNTATSKWDAIDYGTIINTDADTPEDVIGKVVPNWFSIEIKDPQDSKVVKHYDSVTKWMIMDWFERE